MPLIFLSLVYWRGLDWVCVCGGGGGGGGGGGVKC